MTSKVCGEVHTRLPTLIGVSVEAQSGHFHWRGDDGGVSIGGIEIQDKEDTKNGDN